MIWFDALVVVLAVIYLLAVRLIRQRYSNPKNMKEQSEKLRKLAEEIKKNEHNKKKLDLIYEEQQRIMGEMNKEIFNSMLITFAVLGVFLFFTWGLNTLDPYAADDAIVELADDGAGCDKQAGDKVYSYCFVPSREGTYKVLIYGENTDELKLVYATDEPIPITPRNSGAAVEPSQISQPQEVMITAPYKASARIDQSTRAQWSLPFTIPLLNIHTIYEPTWLFVFATFLVNILFSIFESLFKKTNLFKSASIKS